MRLAFQSRVLNTVRQAGYGKSRTPKLDDLFTVPEDELSKDIDRVQQSERLTRGKSKRKRSEGAALQDRDAEDEKCDSHKVQRVASSGKRGKLSSRSKSTDEGVKDGLGSPQTPTKQSAKRKEYKGYVWVDEEDTSVVTACEAQDPDIHDQDIEYGQDSAIFPQPASKAQAILVQHARRKRECYKTLDDSAQTGPVENVLATRNEDSFAEEKTKYKKPNPLSQQDHSECLVGKREKARSASTSRTPDTVHEEATKTSASERKRERLKRQLEIDMVISNTADDSQVDRGYTLVEEDPDDRLAQTLGDKVLEHTRLIQTSSNKPRWKGMRATSAPDCKNAPSTRKVPVIDSPSSKLYPEEPLLKDAKVLQQMFEEEPKALSTLKTGLLQGLAGARRLPLIGLGYERQKVQQLVEQTVLAGEGNSMLVIGARGTGKTTLVETVISGLASGHQDEFHVVRLNGFVHTDDKLALREIWRQLGREMDVENEDLGNKTNYADTLASLLALLAHPVAEEMGNEAATATSVIFILDEFDLFASHPRQTLLYNLFDVAQSRNAPIAVLGLTTKVNVVDSLEKRVKSRFGQRYVHLSPPKSFSSFQEICLSALSYNPAPDDLLQAHGTDLKVLSRAWNAHISALFQTQGFLRFLLSLYTSLKSISAFLAASLLPISLLTSTSIPTSSTFTTHSLLPPDSKLALIPSLSTLELSLLAAAGRLDVILSTNICTFGMVYEEYVELASKSKLQSSAAGQMAVGSGARVWSKELAKGAWERLVSLELVMPAVGGGRGERGEMWRVDVGLEEIGGSLEGMGGAGMGGLMKWCREI